MIGYILMGLGAYLVADDIIKARRAKNAKLLENGNGSRGSDSNRKPRADGQKPDRDGRVTPIPVKKQRGEHELHQEPIPPVEPDPPGSGPGNDSNRKPDATPDRGKAESVKGKTDKGGKDGAEINLENGSGNDGNHVDIELSGVNEPDGSKAD